MNISPAATGDVPEVAAVSMATAPAANVTRSGQAPGAAAEIAVVATATALNVSPAALSTGTAGKAVDVSHSTATTIAPAAAGDLAGDLAVLVVEEPATMDEQSSEAPATAAETAVVAAAVAIDAIPDIDANPTAGVDIRPAMWTYNLILKDFDYVST